MKYDLALFEQLNAEYRDHPIYEPAVVAERRRMLSPKPDEQGPEMQAERARYVAEKQLRPIQASVNLTGKVVLDFGCGHGWLVRSILEVGQASEVIGVDIQEYSSWAQHLDPRMAFTVADLSRDNPIPSELVDVVVSQVVLEHVERPLQSLAAIYDTLRPGGRAWLRMNLYRSPSASHRYKEVFFPWPHLLFENDICEAFYQKHHGVRRRAFTWVNGMTAAHYLQAAREAGFTIDAAVRKVTPIDVPFYLRFEDKLGRYPALDLETEFLTLVLTKGERGADRDCRLIASVDYSTSQRHLDQSLTDYAASQALSQIPDATH